MRLIVRLIAQNIELDYYELSEVFMAIFTKDNNCYQYYSPAYHKEENQVLYLIFMY